MLSTGALLLIVTLSAPFVASVLAALATTRRVSWLVSLAAILVSLVAYLGLVVGREGVFLLVLGSPSKPLLGFFIDDLGLILAGVVLVVGLAVILFSYDYMSSSNVEHPIESGWCRYYALMMLFVGSMLGVSFSSTFLTLLIFYELTGICSCLLIAFYGGEEDVRAALKAFILTHIGGILFLAALAMLYVLTGRVDFAALQYVDPKTLAMLGLLFLLAGWAKSAQIPFQLWLPAAMVAPTTVSAYLHAAAMVKVGVFTFARFLQYAAPVVRSNLHEFSWLAWLALLVSLATAYYAALSYYRQRDLKRLLAFSTISQLAIMFCAESFTLFQGTPLGVYAAMYHLWNHAYAKALLFLTVGALAYSIGRRSVDDMLGLAYKPGLGILALSWFIGACAISAIPPFNCFFSKLAILFTGFKGPLVVLIAAVLLLLEGYVLTLPVFLKIALNSMTRREEYTEHSEVTSKPTTLMKLALVLLAVMCLLSTVLVPARLPSWW